MSGLLDALDGLTVSADLSATLSPQVTALGNVSVSVQGLAEGPEALVNLEGAIDGMPVAPALEGLGNLAGGLSGALELFPGDVSVALEGLTGPLADLTQTLSVSPAGQISCVFNILREVLKIATGREFGGPLGMPDGAFPFEEMVEIEAVEAALATARTALDDVGPAFDAARVLQFLQEVAPRFDRVVTRFPPIPVITELSQALSAVTRWQGMSGAQLTSEFARTIELAARVIAMPHDRVVAPLVAQARIVADGPATLAGITGEVARIFVELRPQVEAGTARPGRAQMDRLDAAVTRAEALAAALDPDASPLANCDGLVCSLVEERLAGLRVLTPGCGEMPFSAQFRAWLDGLPTIDDDPFAEIETALGDIDLEALTGPLQTVQQACEDAVAAFNDARETVRDQITALVEPVADALDDAIGAAGLAEIQAALDDLPGQIQQFVDDEIVANLTPVRDGISDAIGEISDLADEFDPESLTQPISDAIGEVGALVNNPDVQSAFAEVEAALQTAIDAIANFDIAPAADESINLIGEIDATLAEIDPNDIPDAAKPLIAQGVEVVASINFTAEVSGPIEAGIVAAVEEGPDVVLRAIEEAMTEARVRIEGFRPSAIIADTLDAPFVEALALLEQVSPSALFGRIETALEGVQSRVQILDVGVVVDPLAEVHAQIAGEIDKLRPSELLRPVDEALAAAIEKVYELTGLDAAFAGINDILGEINRWVDVIAEARDLLAHVAGMLENPGDATAQVEAALDGAVAGIDDVDLGGLETAFSRAGAAVALTGRDAVAGAIAGGFTAAASVGGQIGTSAEATRLQSLAQAFPLEAAARLPRGQQRQRMIALVKRLRVAADGIRASAAGWVTLGSELNRKAASIQEELIDYHLAAYVDDRFVLESFATPPATPAALRAEIRAALDAEVGPPLQMTLDLVGAFSPYVHFLVDGLGRVLGAVHGKIDEITGAEGITGTVEDVEAVVNLLREVDLSPVTDPLDALFARIEGAVDAVSPEALRAPLEAARDAIAGLIDLSLLLDPADVAALEAAYDGAVNKLRGLSPSAAIGAPLDAEYEELLATILPVLDLPARLRAALLEAGLGLSASVQVELARVEAAFDEMLRQIPIRTGVEVSASASVSVSVG